jgi:hypothetical protein
VRIEKDYRFETDEGGASLADLFGGRSQLLMYHFMFWTGIHGRLSGLLDDRGRLQRLRCPPREPRRGDDGRVAGPIAAIQAYMRRMGWSFPGIAEDQATVVRRGKSVTVPAGTFADTITVRDFNPLDGSKGTKIYAPHVGLIVDGPLELIDY